MENSSLSDTSKSDENHNSVDQLTIGLSGKVKINGENQTNDTIDLQKVGIEEYCIEDEDHSDTDEHQHDDDDEEDFSEEELLSQMGYADSTPKKEDPNKARSDYMTKEPSTHESITTPTSLLNLVSAFKGSREKEVASDDRRRVSWAPDVYDPSPNLYDTPSKTKGIAGKSRQKGGCKKAGASEGEGRGGSKGKKGGGSKGGAEKGKTAGKGKENKSGDKKKSKKRGGGGGGGGASKYSEFDEL